MSNRLSLSYTAKSIAGHMGQRGYIQAEVEGWHVTSHLGSVTNQYPPVTTKVFETKEEASAYIKEWEASVVVLEEQKARAAEYKATHLTDAQEKYIVSLLRSAYTKNRAFGTHADSEFWEEDGTLKMGPVWKLSQQAASNLITDLKSGKY